MPAKRIPTALNTGFDHTNIEAILRDKPLLIGAPLVEQPELITVKTLSAKIVAQMDMMTDSGRFTNPPLQHDNMEIVGYVVGLNCLVVRTKSTGHLYRLACGAYIADLTSHNSMTIDEANAQVRRLPQLFTT